MRVCFVMAVPHVIPYFWRPLGKGMVRVGLFGVLVFVLCGSVRAQLVRRDVLLYPEKLHQDVDLLREVLLTCHPDPFRFTDSLSIVARFEALKDSIRVPMSVEAFQESLVPVLRTIGDRNCQPQLPEHIRTELYRHRAVLPLRVRVLSTGMYVEEELKGFRSLPPGSRILSINGISADSIVQRLEGLYLADGAIRTYRTRMIEQDLPWALYRVFGPKSGHTVRYVAPDGTTGDKVLFAITGEEMERSRKPSGAPLLPWRASWEAESATMWLTLRTLHPDSLETAGQRPDKFLRSLLNEAHQNKAKALVIDVRGAGGSDLQVAEQVFAHVAKEPFKCTRQVQLRTPLPAPFAAYVEHEGFESDAHAAGVRSGTQGARSLTDKDKRVRAGRPVPKAFSGKVYIVGDGMTTDAAAALVALVKRTGRGRFVGEGTGTVSIGPTGGAPLVFTAPNSGIRVNVPLFRYVLEGTPDGPFDQGEQPRHTIEQRPTAIAKGRDTVRESLLELLREIL
jgi:hypothetical protein